MATINVSIIFYGATNNDTDIIMKGNSDCPYNDHQTYKQVNHVHRTFSDLRPGCSYTLDISGYTAGSVKISVAGDLGNPVVDDTYGPGSFGPADFIDTP